MSHLSRRTLRIGILFILLPLIAGLLVSPKSVAATPIFSDNLNSNSINPAFWSNQIIGTGPSVVATNQTTVVALAANSVNDPIVQYFLGGLSSVCVLRGDFDMKVDYNLLLWPASSGVRVGIRFTQGPGHAVERVGWGPGEALSLPRQVYLTDFADSVQGITGTNDLNGTLRMVRTGGLLTGYYHSSTGWIMIHTGSTQDNAGDVHFGFSVWSQNSFFGGQTTRVGFNNFRVSTGQLLCPTLNLSPTTGPIGTRVQVQGSGFAASAYGQGSLLVTFDDMLLGFATDTNGTFSFTFNIPDAQPGPHLVKALDELTGTSAVASFQVTQASTLALSVDVGTLYFPGDTVAIYTLATLNGTPLTSTNLQLLLTLTRPDGSNITLASSSVGSGLFKATYLVPKTGPIGTYSIVARAHVASVQDSAALTTFEVKLTWLSSQGPALTTTAVATALTGLVTLGTIGWKKGFFRTKPTDE